jgi:hypothetical protein
VVHIATNVLQQVVHIVTNVLQQVVHIVTNVLQQVVHIVTNVLQQVVHIVTNVLQQVVNIVTKVLQQVVHIVTNVLHQVVHIVTNVLRAVKNTQQPQLTCAHILQQASRKNSRNSAVSASHTACLISLQTHFYPNNRQKSILCLTENSVLLHHKDQPVNAAHVENHCLLRAQHATHKHTGWAKHNVFI